MRERRDKFVENFDRKAWKEEATWKNQVWMGG